MDLPKGLVEDDKRIYGELANLSKLPIDLIIQFWRGKLTLDFNSVPKSCRILTFHQYTQLQTRSFSIQLRIVWSTFGGIFGAATGAT